MKKIKLILVAIITMMIAPSVVFAASAKISVTSSSSVVVGNNITVTVKLSSSTKIGSWEMELNYPKEYLELVSTTSEGGGTMMVNSSSGVTSKSYTYKFKAKKSGSAKVSVPSYLVYTYEGMDEMDVSTSSKTIKIMTQSELEATYSSDAYLKSLTVGNYELTPKFDKNTYKYSLEVENDVTSIKISAKENDSKSTVSGTGEYTLEEGNNKIEIDVTAQKGNSLTYTINVYRKELDPIVMDIDGTSLTVIRKSESLPELKTYYETTLTVDGEEIPGLKSEITGYELIALKDEEDNILLYIYEDNEIKKQYLEVSSSELIIYPLELEEAKEFTDYEKREVTIGGKEVEAYSLESKSNTVIFYGQNILTGEYNYYNYDIDNEIISIYSNEINKYYEGIIEKYKYILLGLIGLIIILMLIVIIRKPKVIEIVKEEPKEEPIEEISLVREETIISDMPLEQKKKKKKKKKKQHHEEVIEEEVLDSVEEEQEEIEEEMIEEELEQEEESEYLEEDIPEEHSFNQMSLRDQKKLLKQQKKLLKEERKKEKARKEFDF